MGVVDASECGEVVFFLCVVFGIFVVLGRKFDDLFLVLGKRFFVNGGDVLFEHYNVFLHACFLIHGLGGDGRL